MLFDGNTPEENARRRLEAARLRLREQHRQGSPGIQVCAKLTDVVDVVVHEMYEAALREVDADVASQVALVAHGGYGRRDAAPFSDVDLMLLHTPEVGGRIKPLVHKLTHQIYDAKLQLGFAPRTPREACQLAWQDATIFTSLAESRFIEGSVRLFRKFFESLRKSSQRRSQQLITAIEAARSEEKGKYGDTVYLLCPNVKRTRGGLRDVQLVRWVGFARYGEVDLEHLERIGALLKEDRLVLQAALGYLLQLRNELHFHADCSQDVLSKQEQLRLAELRGFQGAEGMLPVEQLMREYFEHTSEVRYRSANFVAEARHRKTLFTFFDHLFSHRMEKDLRVTSKHIGAVNQSVLKRVSGDLTEVLRLMDLANHLDKRIDHGTWAAIRKSMEERSPQLTSDAAARFLSLLSQPPRLATMLRRLHQLRVLERLVPAVKHARCLLQFNEYHKYTVDEHSLRAVEYAASMAHDAGPVGDAYRGIHDKRLLHLALLLHDLGKGFPEDHSIVGGRLARETAGLLGLNNHDTETLVHLVENHLKMAHTAFRHDLSDESVIVRFAVEMGRVDRLQMMYVLTCADLAAVGPDVLNSWKLDLLTELYDNTRWRLASDSPSESPASHRMSQRRAAIRSLMGGEDRWAEEHLSALPSRYLLDRTPQEAVDELQRLRTVNKSQAAAWGRWIDDRQTMEYIVGAHEEQAPGIFHRLTGALSSSRHQILAAEIHTLPDCLVLDRFFVRDLDFRLNEPPHERKRQVSDALVESLMKPTPTTPKFKQVWIVDNDQSHELSRMPTRVEINNGTSVKHTIVSVFSYDCLGLLYTITRTLFELGLSVTFAKIGTFVDQVVDVFYVTDGLGNKIQDEQHLEEIRRVVAERVDAHRRSVK